MTLRTLLFLVVFGALAAFVLVNWQVLNTPTTLSLAFTEVQAPLGLVMLAFIVLVTVLLLGYIVYLQMSGLLESRRHGKEMQAQRELADQAESSRFTELRASRASRAATIGATKSSAPCRRGSTRSSRSSRRASSCRPTRCRRRWPSCPTATIATARNAIARRATGSIVRICAPIFPARPDLPRCTRRR